MTQPTALARAIERRDWQTAAHYLVAGAMTAASKLPRATLDDLIAALARTEDRDDRRDG